MDFYIIELRDRIKIGISKIPKKRVNSIQLSSGISDKEIISLHYFENGSSFESRLKRIFNPYQTKGEWFTKKNTVKLFIDKINNGSLLNNELIEELKYSPSVINHAYYKQAKKTYEKIKEERKGIGYPDSVSIEKILKNNKVVYRHIDYILSNDYKTYTRKLKFELDNINQPQLIQCLRTIKNLSKCTDESNHIQEQIDKIFNKELTINEFNKLKDLIKEYFDSQKYIRYNKTDIRLKEENSKYYFEVDYGNCINPK